MMHFLVFFRDCLFYCLFIGFWELCWFHYCLLCFWIEINFIKDVQMRCEWKMTTNIKLCCSWKSFLSYTYCSTRKMFLICPSRNFISLSINHIKFNSWLWVFIVGGLRFIFLPGHWAKGFPSKRKKRKYDSPLGFYATN